MTFKDLYAIIVVLNLTKLHASRYSLRVTLFESGRSSKFYADSDGKIRFAGGRNALVENFFHPVFNVTYVKPLKSQLLGNRHKSALYSGALGVIQRDEADVLGWTVVMEEHNEYFKWSKVVTAMNTKILTKKGSPHKIISDISSSIKSFSIFVWLLIFASVALFFLIVRKVMSFEGKGCESVGWHIFSTALKQNHKETPTRKPAATFTTLISLFTMFVCSYFYGSFKTNLVTLRQPPRVDTLSDVILLAKKPALSFEDSSLYLFRDSPDKLHNEIFQLSNEVNHNFPKSISLYRLLYKEIGLIQDVAIIGNEITLYYSKKFVCCIGEYFYESKGSVDELLYSFALSNNISNELLRAVDKPVQWSIESGLYGTVMKRLEKSSQVASAVIEGVDWYCANGIDLTDDAGIYSKVLLRFANIKFTFLTLTAFLSTTFIVLVCELLYNKHRCRVSQMPTQLQFSRTDPRILVPKRERDSIFLKN